MKCANVCISAPNKKKRPLAHSEQSHTIQIKTCKTLINLCVSSYI